MINETTDGKKYEILQNVVQKERTNLRSKKNEVISNPKTLAKIKRECI